MSHDFIYTARDLKIEIVAIMNWQTSITVFILAIATGILFRRVGGFLRSGWTGKCGSCGSCGDSAKDKTGVQLVSLGSGTKSEGIAGDLAPESHEAGRTEAGVEKTH